MSEDTETPNVVSTETDTLDATTAADKRIEMLRDLVMRQTGYNADEAFSKLKEHNNDILKIVREYMGVPVVASKPKSTTNQIIYREMRGLMDSAATTHRLKKELEEKKQQYSEMMIRQHAAAAQKLRANIGLNNNTLEADTDASSNTIGISEN